MQRIKRKIKTNVSILLILAMLLGGIPQNALVAQATEETTGTEQLMEQGEAEPLSISENFLEEEAESGEKEQELIEEEDSKTEEQIKTEEETDLDQEEGLTDQENAGSEEEGSEEEGSEEEDPGKEDSETTDDDAVTETDLQENKKEEETEKEETEKEQEENTQKETEEESLESGSDSEEGIVEDNNKDMGSLSGNDTEEEEGESLSDNTLVPTMDIPGISTMKQSNILYFNVNNNYTEGNGYLDWLVFDGIDNVEIEEGDWGGYAEISLDDNYVYFDVYLSEDAPEYCGITRLYLDDTTGGSYVLYDEENDKYSIGLDYSQIGYNYLNITLGVDGLDTGEEKIIKFSDKASKVSYKVDTVSGNGVKVKTDEYKLKKGESIFEFEVKEEPPYEAEVSIEPQGRISKIEDNGNTKIYYLINKSLADTTNITITQKEVGYKEYPVTFSLDNTRVSYKLSIDGVYVEPDEIKDTDSRDTITYMVPYGKEVQVEVSNLNSEFYEITSAYIRASGEKALFSKFDKSIREGFSYSFQVKNNVSVDIGGKNKYSVSLVDENDNPVVSEGNVFSVRPDTYYTIKMFGAEDQVDISDWWSSITSKLQDPENTIFEVRSSYNGWMEGSLYISSKEAGKEIEIQLSDAYYESKQTIKLKVQPNLTKVALTGAKSGKITVEEYSTQVFPIVTTPANANTENLNFYTDLGEDVSDFIITLSDDKKSLIVESIGPKNKGSVIITFVDDAVENVEYGKFTLSATDLKVKSVTPKVELINATNKSLNLKLSASGIQTSDYQYEIIASPVTKKDGMLPDGVIPQLYTVHLDYDPKLPYQEIEVNVQEDLAYNYNVKVVLLFKTDDEIQSKSVIKTFSTLPASYETALKLKKGAATVYTGQKDVVIATAQFSSKTTYRSIVPINETTRDNGRIHVISDDRNNILVSVDKGATPGKYEVMVTAQAPSTMKNNSAYITFTVERGIEELEVQAPINLYKENKKAASFTPVLEYNASYGTEANARPKLKKVEWSIAKDAYGEELFPENHPFTKYLSVNKTTGKVTVDKNYIIQQGENSFYLVAKAVDFVRPEEEKVIGVSEKITVTNQKTQPGQVLLVEKWYSHGEELKIISEGNDTILPEELKKAQIVVIKQGAERPFTTEDCLDTSLFKLTSTAKNFKLDSYGVVQNYDYKTAKNITITAATTDGGSVKTALTKLNIGSEEVTEYRLAAEAHVDLKDTHIGYITDGKNEEKEFNFSGPKDTILKIFVVEKEGEEWKNIVGQGDYTLTVTGGKILSQQMQDNSYTILTNKKTVQISLKYKDLSKKQQEIKYTFVNEGISETKAPVIKANGSILANFRLSGGQSMSLTLPKGTVVDGGKITHAYITLDNSTAGKSLNYNILNEDVCEQLNNYCPLTEDSIPLTFKSDDALLKKEDIKLNIVLGRMDEDKFIPETGTVSVKLKTVAYELTDGQLNPNYTISLKDSSKVLLTFKNKKLSNENLVVFPEGLKNDNIKGKENKFWQYFEVDYVVGEGTYLQLKEGVEASAITSADLTGWILNYTAGDDVRGMKNTNSQIKVTLKDASTKKYTSSAVTVKLSESTEVQLPITADKEPLSVSKVFIDNDNITGKVEDGQIILTVENAAALKASNTVTVYVIPKDSCYKNKEINDRVSAAKYGVKVTAIVKIVK